MASILLVDDEALVRRVVRIVLEAEGHDVYEAAAGDEALRVVEASAPDAVVLDLVMPDSDGYAICRELKGARPQAKVLVLTSVPEDESGPKAREAGADDVMVKPFSALALLDRVAAMLASP